MRKAAAMADEALVDITDRVMIITIGWSSWAVSDPNSVTWSDERGVNLLGGGAPFHYTYECDEWVGPRRTSHAPRPRRRHLHPSQAATPPRSSPIGSAASPRTAPTREFMQ